MQQQQHRRGGEQDALAFTYEFEKYYGHNENELFQRRE